MIDPAPERPLEPDAVAEPLARLKDAEHQIKEWEGVREQARRELISLLGGAEVALVGGRRVYQYKPVEQMRLDTQKLKETLPDVYGSFLRASSYMRFTVL